jgi:hypothetical protein
MFDLQADHRSKLLGLASQAPDSGALSLDPTDPEQHALIAHVLEASNKGADRYPALHRALGEARGNGASSANGDADDCTIVDMGQDRDGRATARGWLASRGGAYISGASTLLFDHDSGELLAAGGATQVGGTLAQASTVSAQAKPATGEMTAVTLFHAQQAPDAPARFGLVAATRPTLQSSLDVKVTAPMVPGEPTKVVRIGLCRIPSQNKDVVYEYPPGHTGEEPDRLVAPFVAVANLPYEIDSGKPVGLASKLYVTSAAAWKAATSPLLPGLKGHSGYQVSLEYPYDKKPITSTESIQYELAGQAQEKHTAFFFQCTVPLVGIPSTLTFTVCSVDTPEEPSLNCTVIGDLEYVWHCLGEDTRVTLADGSELAIAELENSHSVRTGAGEESAAVEATYRAIHSDNAGREPARRLLTEGGRSLLLSTYHPVITPSGPVAAVDLSPGDVVLAAGGEDRVKSCAAEAYEGVVYNLQLVRGAGGFGSFLANGIVVGDQVAQSDHVHALRHNAEYVLARLPESHHQDYLSALADATAR